MTEFRNDIPIPEGQNKSDGVQAKLRELAAQEVGTSILLVNAYVPSLSNQKYTIERKTGAKFATRTVPGGVRVWRVA